MAGVPFKTAGSTNVIHVVKLAGDEKYVPAAALLVPAGVLGWWGVGQIFGPRRDVVVHPDSPAPG